MNSVATQPLMSWINLVHCKGTQLKILGGFFTMAMLFVDFLFFSNRKWLLQFLIAHPYLD